MKSKQNSLKRGKTIFQTPDNPVCACDLEFSLGVLKVYLADDNVIFVPLSDFSALEYADTKARKNWRLIGLGRGIHWEDLDEDLFVAHLADVYGVQKITTQAEIKWETSLLKPFENVSKEYQKHINTRPTDELPLAA